MASSLGAGKMVTAGLVLHLDAANDNSYPRSGTTWRDLSPTATSASLINGPSFSPINAGGIVFDGTNDYCQVSHTSEIMPTSQITFGAIFKITNWSPSTPIQVGYTGPTIMSKETFSSVSVNSGYLLRLDSSGSIYFRINNNGARIVSSSNGTIQTGSIYHAFTTFDGTRVSGYVNGVLIGTSSYVGTVGSSTNTLEISRNADGFRVTGSIYLVQVYNRALSADEVLQNYESTRERFGLRGIAIDPDASLFLQTAGITDTTQQSAIDTLVLELKNAGIWSKMKAIYPFVGGTASTHKWNLKDPRDVDAAFRLTFTGGWTHSSTGAKGNGSNAWANTNLNARNNLTNGDFSISCYVVTGTVNGSNYSGEINCNANPYNAAGLIGLRVFNRLIALAQFNGGNDNTEGASASSTTLGYAIGSETSNSNRKFYKNNSLLATNTTNSTTLLQDGNLWLLWGGYDYATSELALVHIGSSLTDAEASSLYTIVQKYQTTLGRQV